VLALIMSNLFRIPPEELTSVPHPNPAAQLLLVLWHKRSHAMCFKII
jgi:hypothetical protein